MHRDLKIKAKVVVIVVVEIMQGFKQNSKPFSENVTRYSRNHIVQTY